MAGLAIPAGEGLGALALRAAVALGIGGAAAGAAKKVASQSKTSECEEGSGEPECNRCGLQQGFIGTPPGRYIAETNYVNYDYQLYIANLRAGPERFAYVMKDDSKNSPIHVRWHDFMKYIGMESKESKYTVTEWNYGGTYFDGFWRSRCTVVEAKGNYDAWDKVGSVKKPWLLEEIRGWSKGAYHAQQSVVNRALPQGKLEWHFMQRDVHVLAVKSGLPASVAYYTPFF